MTTVVRRILILGAGYGGLAAAVELAGLAARSRARDVEILLVDAAAYHTPRARLPEVVSRQGRIRAQIPLAELSSRRPGLQFRPARVVRIDPARRTVEVSGGNGAGGGALIFYDRLVVALGARPRLPPVPGLAEHTRTVCGYQEAAELRRSVWLNLQMAHRKVKNGAPVDVVRAMARFAVVGGTPFGVELAGHLKDWVDELARRYRAAYLEPKVFLVEPAGRLLPHLPEDVGRAVRRALEDKGVEVHVGAALQAVEPGALLLAGGRRIGAQNVIWAGDVQANPILQASGLGEGEEGRIRVSSTLESLRAPGVYAVGASAAVEGGPPAATADLSPVAAGEQGRVAARNLWAGVKGGTLTAWRPADPSFTLSLGRRQVLLVRGGRVLQGLPAAVARHRFILAYAYRIGGFPSFARELGSLVWPGVISPQPV